MNTCENATSFRDNCLSIPCHEKKFGLVNGELQIHSKKYCIFYASCPQFERHFPIPLPFRQTPPQKKNKRGKKF